MQHLNLWLERYGERRVEILSNWSHAVEEVENLKGKIPCDVLFDKVERHPKPDYRMCFIDGGEGLRELMGLGVYFIKASGLTL
ncbi:MAG: hypothetical protein KKD39_00050, partial [Candidatus Altiarchaeota archaeon]|nr:hypothetical protein [Candidatus Altiarchaeota archaeon]